MGDKLIEATRANGSIHASLIRAALEQAGIKSCVDEDYEVMVSGWAGDPRVYVLESDLPRATDVIKQLEEEAQANESTND